LVFGRSSKTGKLPFESRTSVPSNPLARTWIAVIPAPYHPSPRTCASANEATKDLSGA